MHRVTAAFVAALVALAAPIARAADTMEVLSSVESQTAYDYASGIIQANGAYSYATCDKSPACVAKVRGCCKRGEGDRRTMSLWTMEATEQ
jgi:hypothetical protein